LGFGRASRPLAGLSFGRSYMFSVPAPGNLPAPRKHSVFTGAGGRPFVRPPLLVASGAERFSGFFVLVDRPSLPCRDVRSVATSSLRLAGTTFRHRLIFLLAPGRRVAGRSTPAKGCERGRKIPGFLGSLFEPPPPCRDLRSAPQVVAASQRQKSVASRFSGFHLVVRRIGGRSFGRRNGSGRWPEKIFRPGLKIGQSLYRTLRGILQPVRLGMRRGPSPQLASRCKGKNRPRGRFSACTQTAHIYMGRIGRKNPSAGERFPVSPANSRCWSAAAGSFPAGRGPWLSMSSVLWRTSQARPRPPCLWYFEVGVLGVA
jgi:hypothetical protein